MDIHLTGELSERIIDGLTYLSAAYSDQQNCIRVYAFADAPQELRALMHRGGDEDWIAVVPANYENRHYIAWLETGKFGINVESTELVDGTVVYLAFHS